MRWSRGFVAGAIVGAIAFAFACSSFDEPATVHDGNDGGGDGNSPGNDAAPPIDANVVDGKTCMPAPSGCAGGILQQLDFASKEIPPLGWQHDDENGSVGHVEDAGACSPGLFRSSAVIPNEAGASAQAHIFKRFTGKFKSARVAFAFRGPIPLTDGYANIGCLLLMLPDGSSTPRTQVRLTLSEVALTYGGNIRIADGGFADAGPALFLDQNFGATTATTWHTVDTKFVIADDAVAVSTTYDGTALKDFAVPLLEPSGRIDVECGLNYADEEGASYTHDLDDVFVELCP